MSGQITTAAFSALRWNYLGFAARSGANFIIGIFLARILGPKPFGQLAAAIFVVGIANLLADAGFTSALIQAPTLSTVQIRYVFTTQFVIAIAMTLGCAGIAGWVASAFHDPGVRGVLLAISPLFIFQAFGQTANALLRRELGFRTVQIFQISSYFIAYLPIGIPLALFGAGVWSLVIAQLVQAIIFAGLLYNKVRHPIRPSWDNSGSNLLRFGAKVTVSNLVNYGISNADNFVVGHAFGSLALGYYNRGFTLASGPTDGIVGTMQQVLFASCSRSEGRRDSIRRAYLACLSAIGFLVLPAYWALSTCSSNVIVGLYGETWRPASPLFQPLILALSLHALMAMAGPVLGSLDLVQREIQAQTLTFVVAIAAFWASSKYSVLALAWAVCGVYLFRMVVNTIPVLKALELRWRDVGRALVGPLLVALVTSASCREVAVFLTHLGIRPVLSLLVLIAVGAISFAFALILTSRLAFSVEFAGLLNRGLSGMPRPMLSLFSLQTPPLAEPNEPISS